MIGKTISHYKIIERIGAGGMGTVYRARDTKLDRFVALKFLQFHISGDEEQKQRFIREAKAASALDHPNICTIHGIGETDDGHLFLAMACYEGETLDKRIARGRLATKEAISIGTQIASGLAAVHSRDIVHRDIKPANIFITRENQVKIVDFGLAKLAAGTRITKEGTTLGTVAYMSPEQTRGANIDHRTDIWSLGVVLYEMLTGERPFQGDVGLAVIYNIVNSDPAPISQRRSDASSQLQELIDKALQKEAHDRHENMNAFLTGLERAAQPTTKTPNQDIPAITVLPFTNMSAEPEQEYFCDGMAEEIINALMTLKGMRVTARTSSFQFKDKQVDVREIGKVLGVDMVLEGSVRKAGNQLRITAQLINVADGFHVWSQRYDRDLEDVFAIQDDISKAIVTALRVQLEMGEEAPLVQRPTERIEAYDAYLKGLYLFNQRSESNNDKAIAVFEEAIKLDSTFALAYAGLAYAYSERVFSYVPAKEWEDKAFAALERALELDPDLAEAHAARGNLLWTKSQGFPHRAAIAEYERAIELKPDLAQAYNDLARVLWHVGALDRAFAAFEKALQIDPAFVNAQSRLGMLEVQRGNFERALHLLEMVPDESMSDFSGAWILTALLYLDRRDEAGKLIAGFSEEQASSPSAAGTVSVFLAVEGREKEAEERIQYALENGKDFGHFHHITNEVAIAYALMGKKDLAFKYLEETVSDGFPCYSWFERDPFLESIRDEPRFIKMINDMRKEWGDLETT